MVQNSVIAQQLQAGAHAFTVPMWHDLADDEADIANDDPAVNSTPKKIATGKQIVRKNFLHQSWSAMNLASEIAGDDALAKIQARVQAYWERQVRSGSLPRCKAFSRTTKPTTTATWYTTFPARRGRRRCSPLRP